MEKLPPMEFSFEINKKGSSTQKVYAGKFIYKRLSIGSQGRAEVLKTQLNGDLSNVDAEVDRLHEMLSWLRYGLIEYPSWWRESNYGTDLYDINIVKELYDSVTDFEKKWIEKVREHAQSVTENSDQ